MLVHGRRCLLAPANVHECFHMLTNACDSYVHERASRSDAKTGSQNLDIRLRGPHFFGPLKCSIFDAPTRPKIDRFWTDFGTNFGPILKPILDRF